jgi:TrmH family RNA methyltransferase
MKRITSSDNPLLKTISKLNDSAKDRAKLKKTVLDGIHLIETYSSADNQIDALIVSESGSKNKEISDFINRCQGKEIILLSDSLFKKISPVATPTGILALIDIPAVEPIPQTIFSCLLLEAIQDTGNLGSILRSAAAAAVKQIFLSQECADAWSPKTLRAAMGAQFFLEIYEAADLIAIAKRFKGKIIATSPHARSSLYETDLRGEVAWIIGNEGAGVSAKLLEAATHTIKIPMPGKTESLNVAAATAVCLFEKTRQDRI